MCNTCNCSNDSGCYTDSNGVKYKQRLSEKYYEEACDECAFLRDLKGCINSPSCVVEDIFGNTIDIVWIKEEE